jgi:pyrroloquinoline-quinone synthase
MTVFCHAGEPKEARTKMVAAPDFTKELRELRRTAHSRLLLKHPFFEVLASDQSRCREAIRVWSTQDYYVAQEFPCLVAAIAARIADPRLRHTIVVNLWEEHGEGNLSLSHAALFDLLLQDIGVRKSNIDPPLSTTRDFIEMQLNLTAQNVLCGLGAFCYANEYLTLWEFRPIQDACALAYPNADLSYFIANRQADGKHAREAERVIAAMCSSERDLELVAHGAEAAINSRVEFYDGVLRQLG